VIIIAKRERGVSQHILTDETGGRQGHFFGFAFFTADLPPETLKPETLKR
jgi:hypothetical protein